MKKNVVFHCESISTNCASFFATRSVAVIVLEYWNMDNQIAGGKEHLLESANRACNRHAGPFSLLTRQPSKRRNAKSPASGEDKEHSGQPFALIA